LATASPGVAATKDEALKDFRIRLRFIVDQKEEPLFLKSLVSLFGAGYVQKRYECKEIERSVSAESKTVNVASP
jgi:hypothetical protein